MPKQGMKRPDSKETAMARKNREHTPGQKDGIPVPELSGKVKSGKEKAKPLQNTD